MKINIAALMTLIAEEEKKLNNLTYSIKNYIFNTTTQELDGKENVIEDNKLNFDLLLNDVERTTKKLSILKSILYDKNNSFKLSDNRTIQQAIVENTNLRKLKQCYESLLECKNTKKRISEVNNSYFECKTLNFNQDEIRNKLKDLDLLIQNTDFEISKLNSKEFEINI